MALKPSGMRRRGFLKGVGGSLLLNSFSTRAACPQLLAGPPLGLAQGVIAGEVSDTSAILQSRLTSTNALVDAKWSGIPGIDGVACFELSRHSDFRNPLRTNWIDAAPENDHIVKTRVSGLQPGARYYYRLIYGSNIRSVKTSPVCSLRMHGGSETDSRVRFAVINCLNYSAFHHTGGPSHPFPYQGPDKHLGYPTLESILRLKPDYLAGLGDIVYYDEPRLGRAESRHQMRMKFQEQFSQPRFPKLLAQVPTYWCKDDHDYRYNDSDPINPFIFNAERPETRSTDAHYPKTNLHPKVDGSGFAPSPELGIELFREQLPIVDPAEKDAVTYRTYRINPWLQVWLVEGRDYRSPNDLSDGPQKSIWGTHQKQWLQDTLLGSDATFKILLTPTPLVGPDARVKRDNHVNWGGFRYEADTFFRWLVEHDFLRKNFYIVNGDRHWQYHAIHPSEFEEFSVGTVDRSNATMGFRPGDPDSSDPEGKIRHSYHNEKPTGGFLMITVQAANVGQPPKAEMTFYNEMGTVLYRHVKHGQTT
ncbi:MAG: alkaline phosphatase [Acidobacteria bacterium]|nr:alkaline phosphatase [Acidobacteriota bacterium]